MKILIVDDNYENLYMLETLLRGNGYEVTQARNGLDALDRLRAETTDLIISDVLMPKMDGFQLCRTVRADEGLKNTPFIFYTATYTDPKDIAFGLSIGADRFLIKPQDTDVILRVILDVISERNDGPFSAEHPLGDEMEFFRQYNETLFRKLEKKIADLNRSNTDIQKELIKRRHISYALRESRERISLILNTAAEGIYGIDLQGNCMFCNASGIGMLSYADEKELIGKNMHELIHHTREDGSHYPASECQAHRILTTGDHFHSERDILWRKDGKSFLAEYWAHPLLENGEIKGAVVTFIDITQRTALETQLRQAQKMESIGHLAGGVAHDFNNILTAIIGYSSMSLDEMAQDDLNRHNIEQVLAAANRGAVLTQSLLAFGRKQAISLASINLNDVVLKFEKFLFRLLREDIELKTSFFPLELPIKADRGQIEQVLMNLVSNARDAMPKGGCIAVETSLIELDTAFTAAHGLGTAGEYALLSVTDTGVGMADDVKRNIFEPFFTTKEEGQGTGLGLAMVFGIVKQHKGYIDVFGAPGVGSTFNVYLPLDRSAKESEEQKTCEQYPLRGGTETVLVAEDDVALRQLAAAILRNYGYTAIEAVDGADAVAKFRANRGSVSIVVLDGIMPKLNGKNAWHQIKALRPDIKAIFISGYPEKVFTKDTITDDKVAFVQKPYSPLILLRKIREVLDK